MALLALWVAACGTATFPAPVEYKSQSAALPVPAVKPAVPDTSRDTRPAAVSGAPITTGSYVVQANDTLYQVARRSGVALRDIIEANRLTPPYHLRQGQRLRIPQVRYHIVAQGETLSGISRRYDVSMHALVRENALPPPYAIQAGQRLRLPGQTAGAAAPVQTAERRPPATTPTAPAAPQPRPATAAGTDGGTAGVPLPGSKPLRRTTTTTLTNLHIPKPPRRTGGKFSWPAQGRVISRFGVKQGGLHNDGINIALPAGAPVKAAESGVVAYAGNELRAYGNLVLLRHDGGWVTAYAHADTIVVRVGDVVRRGQTVATAGQSGGVSRPQLHFELRKGRKAVDPLRYLGPRPTAARGGPGPGFS